MIYEEFIYLPKHEARRIRKALEWKEGDNPDDRLTGKERITHTVVYEDGFEMNIECINFKNAYDRGKDNYTTQAIAILLNDGKERNWTNKEGNKEYFGTWELSYNGNTYRAFVRQSKSKFDYSAFCADYSIIAVSKEKYSLKEAIGVAKREFELETGNKMAVMDKYVRFRAGVDENGEKQVGWWLEGEAYATSCPVWSFCVLTGAIEMFGNDYTVVNI